MKNSIFARFARAFFIFWHFVDVLVLSTTWNDQFCSWVDDISIWWQMFNCVFLCPKRRFQLNFRIVRTHFSSIMSLNNWKMIAETRIYIFRWRSRFRRRRDCLSSLMPTQHTSRRSKPAGWFFSAFFLSPFIKKRLCTSTKFVWFNRRSILHLQERCLPKGPLRGILVLWWRKSQKSESNGRNTPWRRIWRRYQAVLLLQNWRRQEEAHVPPPGVSILSHGV